MESTSAKDVRFCTCYKCGGKDVNKKTFYSHTKNLLKHHAENEKLTHHLSDDKDNSYTTTVPWNSSVKLKQPLYSGSNRTLHDAIAEQMFIFATNNGMSKTALSQCLLHEKEALPQPNLLPSSFQEAVTMIGPSMLPIHQYKCCINDCVAYPVKDKTNDCPVCKESLYYSNNRLKKTFHYMPFVARIARWFGTKNLAKVLHSNKLVQNGKLSGYTDGDIFQRHLSDGIFQDTDEANCVPLALFTDGVNPNKNSAVQKSMWPIMLSWISLPHEMRYILGPMMLVGIVPGHGRKEPKSLDPYINILVDELLSNLECQLYDSYKKSPVNVKIALLQYLCDIPAFSKLLHCSGQGALRSCMFCKDVGIRNSSMSKVIHVSNRQFIPLESTLRNDTTSFAIKTVIKNGKPDPFLPEEELELRKQYDNKPNKNQQNKLQKETGFKGMHPLHRLPYFNRSTQMQTDGMHTISDVIGNILDLVSGKTDSAKVRLCEETYNRFPTTWIGPSRKRKQSDANPPTGQTAKKAKKDAETSAADNPADEEKLPEAPWRLSKEKLKIADNRASKIKYPRGVDYTPADHFTRQWTLRTMHGKQQFITKNVAAWCLRGLLGKDQESTLFNLFNVIRRLVQPNFTRDELPSLMRDTSIAVTLLERDFPLTLQNLTTHLLHHIPEGFTELGPLYDRWLYPLERANSWIARQILRHGHEEASIMQTYRIYDWSAYNLLSGVIAADPNNKSSLARLAESLSGNNVDNETVAAETTRKTKLSYIDEEERQMLLNRYCEETNDDCTTLCDIDPFVKTFTYKTRYDTTSKRDIYLCTNNQKSSRTCDYIVYVRFGHDNLLFGQVSKIFEHSFHGKESIWVTLLTYPQAQKKGMFYYADNELDGKTIVRLGQISNPLVTAEELDKIWFLNV